MKKKFLLFLFYSLCFVASVYSQNVGIGTNTPAFKLDVRNGSINTDSVYRIGGNRILSAPFQNTFIGIGTAGSITTGDYNTAVGNEALYSNTAGERNTAVGLSALRSNISGNRNTAIGKSALHVNSTGSFNTATGYETLYYNTTGEQNTAVGDHAMLFNTTGNYNTATGTSALARNTEGDDNSAYGYTALYANTGGRSNTANGSGALYSSTLSNGNVAIGYHSLYTATNGFNTAIGSYSMDANVNGLLNVAIGCYTDVIPSDGTISNSIVIGNSAIVDGSNKARIGNTLTNSIGGQVSWTSFSDGRYKQNVQEDVPGIVFISKLRPVTYTVDIKSLNENYYRSKPFITASDNSSDRHSGFIAQEVERSAEELGFSFSGVDKPERQGGLYGLRYAEFVVPLAKAVQEQQQQLTDMKKEIDWLKEQNKILTQLLNGKN